MKLSIITINYNDAVGLQKTLESVSLQTIKNFEHLVIDGNSTDNSVDVIKKYSHITYWISETDGGIYNAMNKGINMVNGEYLLFLNSGDYLANNNVIEDVLPQLANEAIIYGNMVIDRNNVLEYAKSPQKIEFEEMIRGTLWHPVSFIKKELFLQYGLYNEKYKIISDYDFFLKTIVVNRVTTKHIQQFITVFNTNGIGSSKKHQALHDAEKYEVQTSYFHPMIVESALSYARLKRSKAQIIYQFIKTKPLAYKASKWFYKVAKKFV